MGHKFFFGQARGVARLCFAMIERRKWRDALSHELAQKKHSTMCGSTRFKKGQTVRGSVSRWEKRDMRFVFF